MDEIDPKRIVEEPEIPRKTAVILTTAGALIAVALGAALWSSHYHSDPLFPDPDPAKHSATAPSAGM